MLCLPRENAISCVEAVAWGVCSQAGIQPSLGWGPGAPSPPWTLGLCTYYAHPRTSTAPGPPHLSSPLPLDLPIGASGWDSSSSAFPTQLTDVLIIFLTSAGSLI